MQQIENLIIEEIVNKHGDNIKTIIENLPINKKRIAMFASLCNYKDNELKNMIKELESISKIDKIDKILENIRKYIGIGEVEKKTFGEIFTPFNLINDMLDTLPAEVWSNPELKFGDFCNGIGNFMVVVVKRLMIGLKDWQPDEELRYKHILENMIYVSELQAKNMFLWLVFIDPKNEYKLNTFKGSSLSKEFTEHCKNVWKVDKFSVLVANPPYQIQKEGNKKTQPIWHLFVEKYISILEEGGYMTMVHPSGWRNVDGIFKKTQQMLISRQLHYLEIHNSIDGQKIFNATTPYDFYLLQNTKPYKNTQIKYNDDIEIVDISKMEFIPNANFSKIQNLIAKDGEEKVEIIYSRSIYGTDKKNMSKTQTDEFKYPCVYSIVKNNNVNYFFSKYKKEHFGIIKLILGNGANPTSFIDHNGQYGMTQFAFGIVDELDALINIENVLKSKHFQNTINLNVKFVSTAGNPLIYPKIIATFRKDFWKEFIDKI